MSFNTHTTSPPSRTSLAWVTLGIFSLPRNVAWVEGEGFRLSFDILDARQPIQSCVLGVRELKFVFPRVRLTVCVLQMLCMCPDCSPNLRCARVPLQFLQRSEQSQGCPHCSSLWDLFFFLLLLCTLLNHLLLQGWQVAPIPAPAGCHCLAEGSRLHGSPSLLSPASTLLQPSSHGQPLPLPGFSP